jgi:hypothetical protein
VTVGVFSSRTVAADRLLQAIARPGRIQHGEAAASAGDTGTPAWPQSFGLLANTMHAGATQG